MGSIRSVSAVLIVGGKSFVCDSLQINQTQQQNCDTLSAVVALNAPGSSLDFWANLGTADAKALVNGVPLFLGTCDVGNISFDSQRVSVSGRDKSKGMIEAKSSESFKNKPSSQIVQEIASRHGLTPVIEATSGRAGKTQQIDWTHITDEISEWTLIQRLADNEGKVAYVMNNELRFESLDSGALGSVNIFYAPQTPLSSVQGNFQSLSISHNHQAGRRTKVGVHSWHTKRKEAQHQYHEEGGNGAIVTYDYKHAGLEPGQAKAIAQKRCREIKRQEITVEYGGPGDPSCRPAKVLNLRGAGAYDQGYFIDKVSHDLGNHGYRMSVTAKNSKGGGGGTAGSAGASASSGGASSSNLSNGLGPNGGITVEAH